MKPLLATDAMLLATGLALGNGDVALLAAVPLASYAVNALLPPPRIAVAKRREGSYVEVYIRGDRLPGVLYIYDAAPLDAPGGPRRWALFKPPLKRTLRLRYREEAPGGGLVVEVYNPAMTKRAVVVYAEEPRAAAPPAKPWEGAEEFAEVKPYQPGDPLRRVNWRAFAKTGELYVNKYAGSERGRAVVVVDARRLRGAVVEAAAKAAAILAERGYDVSYFVLGHGEAQEVPKSFTPSCTGRPPCADLVAYVGSLRDPCPVDCPRVVYIDVAARNPLAAIRRLSLYRELRARGAEVLTDVEKLAEVV